MSGSKSVALVVGDSAQLNLELLRGDGTDAGSSFVQWASRSAAVSVSSSGLVCGVTAGTNYGVAWSRVGELADSVLVSVNHK